MSKLQDEGNDSLAILCQESVSICDTDASMHVKWCNMEAKNICDTMMYSLGHAGLAMKSNALIDIPGVFEKQKR